MLPKDSIQRFNSEEIISESGLRKGLNSYLDILLEYNKKVNLVSRETSRANLVRLAADCLVPFKFSEPPSGSFFDIGSGGGFPSIILLLAFDNLRGVLYERTQKKARFLEYLVKELNLDALVRPIDWPPPSAGNENVFDLGTMKLVRLDQKILRSLNAALKTGGRFIYYTSALAIDGLDPDPLKHFTYNYYLDDIERLRTVTIFLKS